MPTAATSATRMGRVPRAPMTVAAMASTSASRPTPWIRYSWPPACRKPADVFRLARRSASSTTVSDSP